MEQENQTGAFACVRGAIPCHGCGQLFVPAHWRQEYCRPSCRYRAFERRHHRGPSLPWEESEPPVVATLKPLTRDVARRLLVSLGQWHSMQELADIAGPGGWRSRIVECRLALAPCGYRLENKQGTVETPEGRRRTSAYRLTRAE